MARSFLDYRVPVLGELSQLVNGRLWVLFSMEHTPRRVQSKLEELLGERAIGFDGELSLGHKGNITAERPNSAWRIPYQPGVLARLRQVSPDVVVGDGFFQWTWKALLYRITSGRRLVVCYERTAHTEQYAQWYRKAFRKSVLRYVDGMAVNGSLTREYVESLGFDTRYIIEGQMAADTDTLSARAQALPISKIEKIRGSYSRSRASRVFLTVSRLISLKGIDQLLAGWRAFKSSKNPDDVLLVIGEGVERERLEGQCKAMSISDVHFLGHVLYDDIHAYYAAADWFIIPSLVDNWSLVVPEAMACGLPILCSRYNGCWPELVHDNVNGWVFDPLVEQDIVRVLELAVNTSRRREMSEASRDLAAKHSPAKAAEAIFDACMLAVSR